MNIFSDPLLVVAVVIGIISLILVFLLIEYYKKLKEVQFVNEVINSTQKTENKKTDTSLTSPQEPQQPLVEKQNLPISQPGNNINNSDIVLAQIAELANQINSINDNLKELNTIIKNLSSTTNQNIGLTEKQTEKLVTSLQNIESFISSKEKTGIENVNKEVLEEINTKLDNILKVLTAILQQ
jgi:molecular chaperone GrpE (heat shock protein)